MDVAVFQEIIQQRNGIRIKGTAQGVCDHVQISAGGKEKRAGLQISMGS